MLPHDLTDKEYDALVARHPGAYFPRRDPRLTEMERRQGFGVMTDHGGHLTGTVGKTYHPKHHEALVLLNRRKALLTRDEHAAAVAVILG